MVTVIASKNGRLVRVSAWHGSPNADDGVPHICAAFHITPQQAEKLIAELQEALAKFPRVGTAADLGCEVLP